MIGVNIECRLGNQLFQYAFALGLSKKLGTSFFLNQKTEKFIVGDYFELQAYHPFLNLVNRVCFKLKSGHIWRSLQCVTVDTYQEGMDDQLRDNTIYQGYFQSGLFFKNITLELPMHLRVKYPYQQRFIQKYQGTFSQRRVIAVHLRRGDYLNLNDWWLDHLGSSDLTLPMSYYRNCFEKIVNYENYKIIFVSDDIAYARSAFAHIKDVEFAENDMMVDFQILQHADICILSNSSFAWWAAYLNPKTNKQIFCPENWLGFKIKKEYPDHIIQTDWIKVNVY